MTFLIYSLLCLIWGSTWLAIKIGLQDSPPLWSAGIRFAIAGLLMLLINVIKRVSYPTQLREIIRIAVPGIFMYALSYMLVYVAETYIDSSLTAVLFAGFPFFVAGASYFVLKDERLSIVGWIGMLIGFGGILLVFYDSLQDSRIVFLGAFLAVMGAAAASFGTVYIRAYLKEVNIFAMASIQMTLGAIIMIVIAILVEPLSSFKITFKSMTALFYLAVFGTVVAFLGYYWLLQRMKAITVSQISFVTPLIAVFLGFIFLSESFTFLIATGSTLILAGVTLVARE